MKFSTGLFDSLFGKKTTLRIDNPDGTTREVRVTEAWLKSMEDQGKIGVSKNSSRFVSCNLIGPDGPEMVQLQIGVDIPETQYKKLCDPCTGELYGMKLYQNGEPKTTVIEKQVWKQAAAQFSEIEREHGDLTQRTIDKLYNR